MPVNLYIIEGARGAGKTHLSRYIRETVPEITLINPTGFHQDGNDGFRQICTYYSNWLNYLEILDKQDIEFTFVLDRFFMSEFVYSTLYKSYTFMDMYLHFLNRLEGAVKQITYIHLLLPEDNVLENRLKRDKVPFHDVEESITQSRLQEEMYLIVMEDMKQLANAECFSIESDLSPSKIMKRINKKTVLV